MENKNTSSCSACNAKKKDIDNEVKEAIRKLDSDAPYADVDPEAADVPAEVAEDL